MVGSTTALWFAFSLEFFFFRMKHFFFVRSFSSSLTVSRISILQYPWTHNNACNVIMFIITGFNISFMHIITWNFTHKCRTVVFYKRNNPIDIPHSYTVFLAQFSTIIKFDNERRSCFSSFLLSLSFSPFKNVTFLLWMRIHETTRMFRICVWFFLHQSHACFYGENVHFSSQFISNKLFANEPFLIKCKQKTGISSILNMHNAVSVGTWMVL